MTVKSVLTKNMLKICVVVGQALIKFFHPGETTLRFMYPEQSESFEW